MTQHLNVVTQNAYSTALRWNFTQSHS